MPDYRIRRFLGGNRNAAHAFFPLPDFRHHLCAHPAGGQLYHLELPERMKIVVSHSRKAEQLKKARALQAHAACGPGKASVRTFGPHAAVPATHGFFGFPRSYRTKKDHRTAVFLLDRSLSPLYFAGS